MTVGVKTQEDFDKSVAVGKVLVDFWATWCGPCLMMGKMIETDLEPAMQELKIVKVNVDEAPQLAASYGIVSIPTLFCYKDGKKVAEFVGVTSAAQIKLAFS